MVVSQEREYLCSFCVRKRTFVDFTVDFFFPLGRTPGKVLRLECSFI